MSHDRDNDFHYQLWLLWLGHGITGRRFPDNFLFFRPRLDVLYNSYLVIGQLRSLVTKRRRVSDNNNISQLLRESFSVSQQPPIWEPPSHYSMLLLLLQVSPQSQSRCEPSGGLQLHRLSSASSQSGVSED